MGEVGNRESQRHTLMHPLADGAQRIMGSHVALGVVFIQGGVVFSTFLIHSKPFTQLFLPTPHREHTPHALTPGVTHPDCSQLSQVLITPVAPP